MDGRSLMTSEDVANYFKVDMQKAWAILREHKDVLQAFKVGREYRLERQRFDHLIDLVKQGKIKI